MRNLCGSGSWRWKKINIKDSFRQHNSRFRLEAKTRRFRVCDDCSVLLSLEAVCLPPAGPPLIPAKCGVVRSWVIEDCASASGASTAYTHAQRESDSRFSSLDCHWQLRPSSFNCCWQCSATLTVQGKGGKKNNESTWTMSRQDCRHDCSPMCFHFYVLSSNNNQLFSDKWSKENEFFWWYKCKQHSGIHRINGFTLSFHFLKCLTKIQVIKNENNENHHLSSLLGLSIYFFFSLSKFPWKHQICCYASPLCTISYPWAKEIIQT